VLLETIAPLVTGERFGIVRSVMERKREAGCPDFYTFVAIAADTTAIAGRRNFATGTGSAMTRDRALAKAIGEAIERYASAIYDLDELPLCASADAGFACVPPAEFTRYTAEQFAQPRFGFAPFAETTPARWVNGEELGTARTVAVPAAAVYVPYAYEGAPREPQILQPISTGLACHETKGRATASAICEAIERDAFMLTWQAGIGPPRIDPASLPAPAQDALARFEAAARPVTLFDITYDTGVTTLLAAQQGTSPDQPALCVAAAASLRPLDAAIASLEELALTSHYMQDLLLAGLRFPADAGYEAVVDQRSHLLFWSDAARRPLAEPLFAGTRTISFADLRDRSTGDPDGDAAVLADSVAATGNRVVRVDVTPPDLAALGLHVVRAVVPGFQPLRIGFRNRALGGTRLWAVPQQFGYAGVGRDGGDYAVPHPYP
jgi:ribosomal protein S12 methylthiotransferase accessory factor